MFKFDEYPQIKKSILNTFNEDIYNSYFRDLGFVRSDVREEKAEKRITLYVEKFSKDIGNGLYDVVQICGYLESGVMKVEIAYGWFVPEVYAETFDKNSVVFDTNNLEQLVNVKIDTKQKDDDSMYDLTNCYDKSRESVGNIVNNQVLPLFEKIKNRKGIIEYIETLEDYDFELAYMYGAEGKLDKAKHIFEDFIWDNVNKFANGDIYAKNCVPVFVKKMISLGLPIDKRIIETFKIGCDKFMQDRSYTEKDLKKMDESIYEVYTMGC